MNRALRILSVLLFVTIMLPTGQAFGAEGDGMVLGGDGKLGLSESRPATRSNAEGPVAREATNPFQAIGLVLCVVGLLGGGFLLTRRLKTGAGGSGRDTARLELLERLKLGPRRELLLVRAGNRVLVLADFGQQPRLVANMAKDALEPEDTAQPVFDPLSIVEQARATPRTAAVQSDKEEEVDFVDWPSLSVKA